MSGLGASFRALVGAQFLGAFNDNVYKQVLLFLAASTLFPDQDKQGEAFAVFALPFVLFSGMAGDLSERLSKRRIIVAMKILEIFIMVMGAFALHLRSWPAMLLVLFIMGLQSAFFGPAKYGVIPELVTTRNMLKANGLISMTTFLGVLLGQALAGPLLDGLGDELWAAGCVFAALGLVGTGFARKIEPLTPQKPHLRVGWSPFGRLFRTMAGLSKQEGLLTLVFLYSLFWFDGGVIQQAVVSLGEPGFLDVRDGEKTLLSLVLVTLAVAIMAGSILAPRLARAVGAGRLVLLGSGSTFGAQVALLSIGPVFDRSSGGLLVTHIIMLWIGLSAACIVVPLQTYLQHAPPPGMRGQTWAVNNFMNFLLIFVGGIYYLVVRGPSVGLSPTVAQAVAGGVMMLAAILFRRQIRQIEI